MREASVERKTAETEISCRLALDGVGRCTAKSGCGFFDHMMELFAKNGRFDLALACKGDGQTGWHHTVEDAGIVLGRAFSQALGERRGIVRYGSFLMPMDETLVLLAVDVGGRAMVCFDVDFPTPSVGDMDTDLVQEFLWAFARALGANIHVKLVWGQNSHHIAEAVFKGFGRALAQAVAVDEKAAGEIPSTKGTIT